MVEITCVGELLVDMIADEKGSLKQNEKFLKRPGGAPANVAVSASRMGADVSLIASVGDDEFGEFLFEKMEEEGIETGGIEMLDRKTTLAFASLDKDADPHFSFYRGADEAITLEQLQDIDSDVLHVGSLPFTDEETAENIFHVLNDLDVRVSFDPNIRPEIMTESYRGRLEKMFDFTDILFVAEKELEFFGGAEKLREKIEKIIVTKGEQGAELIQGDERLEASPPEVEVVDTTGAGDAFTGAYLANIDDSDEEALSKGVQASAYSITEKGAMSALPYSNELE